MQVSSSNSLTWLRSATGTAGQTSSASPADGQDALDASGAEGASPSSMLASLQSPSQLFSSTNLGALISAQAGQSLTNPNVSVDHILQGGPELNSSGGTQGSSRDSPIRRNHHDHHAAGGAVASLAAAQTSDTGSTGAASTASTTTAFASAAADDVQASVAQLLTSFI